MCKNALTVRLSFLELPFLAPREKSLTVMVPPVCSSATINFKVRTSSICLNPFLLLFSYITRTQMASVNQPDLETIEKSLIPRVIDLPVV